MPGAPMIEYIRQATFASYRRLLVAYLHILCRKRRAHTQGDKGIVDAIRDGYHRRLNGIRPEVGECECLGCIAA